MRRIKYGPGILPNPKKELLIKYGGGLLPIIKPPFVRPPISFFIKIAPRHAVFELTRSCNLNCLHCGSNAGTKRKNELNTEECINLINQLRDLECTHLTFSGGEPFLKEDWPTIIGYAKANIPEISIVSNGTLIYKTDAAILKTIKQNVIAISLDGIETIHDSLRGENSFSSAVKGIINLKKEKIPFNIITQINKTTLLGLEKLCDFITLIGANSWMLQLTNPMGRAGRKITIEPSKIIDIHNFIIAKRKQGVNIHPAHCIGYYHPGIDKYNTWNGCPGGKSVIGIEANGDIKPCLSMQTIKSIGNIKKKSLKEIWNNEMAEYRKKKEKLKGFCATCSYGGLCKGGCIGTAQAYGTPGDYPYCIQRFLKKS